MVLLALLGLAPEGYVIRVRRRLREVAGRRISRSALYAALDRLEARGLVVHEVEAEAPRRSSARASRPARR